MRKYRIKRGHDADVGVLVSEYFGVKGNIYKGINFEVAGVGNKNYFNTFCKGFKSPSFKAVFHAGISGLRSPGIYAWEDVTRYFFT
jgi:hypothetical protein